MATTYVKYGTIRLYAFGLPMSDVRTKITTSHEVRRSTWSTFARACALSILEALLLLHGFTAVGARAAPFRVRAQAKLHRDTHF